MKDYIIRIHKVLITMSLLFSSDAYVWAIEHNEALNEQRIDNAQENHDQNIERANHGVEELRIIKLEAGKNVLDQWNKLSDAEKKALYADTEAIIKTSGCNALSVEEEKIRRDKELFEQKLSNQGYDRISGNFTSIEKLRLQLDQKTGVMQTATAGIGPLAYDQGSLIQKRAEMQNELTQLESGYPVKEKVYQEAKEDLESCYNNERGGGSNCSKDELAKKEQKFAEAKRIYDDINGRIRYLKNRMWNIVNVDGRTATAAAGVAVSNANAKGAQAESVYEQLIAEITRQTRENEQALVDAMKRLEEAKKKSAMELANIQLSNNADFRLWDQIKSSYGGTSDFDQNNKARIENDIDVLAMASSALSTLTCEDVSDVKTKSYNLFKAASANYMAALINERTEFTKVNQGCFLACVSIEELKRDQQSETPKYPAFADKDFSTNNPNCTTFEGSEGMLVNDPNPDDDKDEQIKSFERVANAQHQLVTNIELKKAHREDGKRMFQDAFNAAMMEYTTKLSRVAAANAQLERAKAWQKKAENSIIIYIAIVAGLAGCAWGPCAGAFAVAVALLAWHRGDKGKADKDVAKWEQKLRESKLHGHLACNYPGEVTETIAEAEGDNELLLFLDKSIPLIYPYAELMPLTTSAPPLRGQKQIITKENMAARLRKVKPLKEKLDNNNEFYKEADNEGQGAGLNQGTKSFRDYMNKKLGAWRLQSFNASKMIDYSKLTFTTDHLIPLHKNGELSYRWNDSSFLQNTEKKIVQKTGYPAPETRIVYMQNIMNLLEGNIDGLEDSLAMSRIYANQYAQLLSRTRNHLTMDVQGLEQDTSAESENSFGGCLKQSENGDYVKDPNCECRQTNSCSNYKTQAFNFKAPIMNLNNKNLKKNDNATVASATTKNANTEGVELSNSKGAISSNRNIKMRLKNSRSDSDNNRNNDGTGADFSAGQSGNQSTSQNNNGIASSANSSDSSNGLNLNNEENPQKVRIIMNGASAKNSNTYNAYREGEQKATSPSLTPTQAVTFESSNQKSFERKENGYSVNFADFNNSGALDIKDMYIEKDGQKFIAKKNKDGSISYYTENGTLVTNPEEYAQLNQKYREYKEYKTIHSSKGPSIFNIISKRYKNTAYKILFPRSEEMN